MHSISQAETAEQRHNEAIRILCVSFFKKTEILPNRRWGSPNVYKQWSYIVRSVCWIVPLPFQIHIPSFSILCSALETNQYELHQEIIIPSDSQLDLANSDPSQEIRGRVGMKTGCLSGAI